MRIHNVFHVSLLEKAPQNIKTPGPIYVHEETQEPYYKVDCIMGTQLIDGKPHYLIHWKGYEHTENTWEPEENLTREVLRDYRRNLRRRQPDLVVEVPQRQPKSN